MRLPSRLTIAIAVTVVTIVVCSLGIHAELAGLHLTADQHAKKQPADDAPRTPVVARD
jgi:hypothetical protein